MASKCFDFCACGLLAADYKSIDDEPLCEGCYLRESVHLANGVAELAIKHRNDAEAKLAILKPVIQVVLEGNSPPWIPNSKCRPIYGYTALKAAYDEVWEEPTDAH